MENGLIVVHLTVGDEPMIKLQNFEKQFSDGKWHDINMSIRPNKLTIIVDEHPAVTNRLLSIKSGLYTYIGGSFSEHLCQIVDEVQNLC